MRKQQLWTGIGASVGMLILILDGKTALEGARLGIELCLRTVIPSLFPFFLLSIMLTSSFLGMNIPILRPVGRLCGIPKGTESILISAFLGGYPVGAQSVAAAYRSGQLEKAEAERMLAFCNNAGPAFLFGMAASMFPKKWMAWALWGIHILSAVLVARMLPGTGKTVQLKNSKHISLSSAMASAITVMAAVCGWVVLFRVVIAFLSRWVLWLLPTAAQVAITGLLELSNGCCELLSIQSIPMRFSVCSGILACGGLCVTMQTVSVTKGLSLRYYFLGKLLQTVFSLLLCSSIFGRMGTAVMGIVVVFLVISQKKQKKSSIPKAVGI